jgi:ADP-ribosylglycohydrolase
LNSKNEVIDYQYFYRKYYRKYPFAGYGKAFKKWGESDTDGPYDSFGNGSAMRVAPVAWAFVTKERVMEEAKKSAECTHSHPDGIKGAQAIALATFMARKGSTKKEIRSAMEDEMGYNLMELERGFSSACEKTVPNAIVAFLNSNSFIDAIRSGVMMGGDSDTIACMAGSIAQPYYGKGIDGIPVSAIVEMFRRLPKEMADVVREFTKKYVGDKCNLTGEMSKKAELYDLYRSIFKSGKIQQKKTEPQPEVEIPAM